MKLILIVLTLFLSFSSWASRWASEKLDQDYDKNPIPHELQASIYLYSANYGSLINGYLRENIARALVQYSPLICALDYTLSKYRIRQNNIVLYRGHGYPGKNGMQLGGIINNEAYTSTTLSQNVALEFVNSLNYPTLDVLLFPNDGIPGIWVRPLSRFPHEDEVLLTRGLQFKIVAINYVFDEAGQKKLVRHMIYQGKAPKNPEVEKSLNCQITPE